MSLRVCIRTVLASNRTCYLTYDQIWRLRPVGLLLKGLKSQFLKRGRQILHFLVKTTFSIFGQIFKLTLFDMLLKPRYWPPCMLHMNSATRLGDFCTLGNFSKPVVIIILPNSPIFMGNFCKNVKIFRFSSEIIFWQLL